MHIYNIIASVDILGWISLYVGYQRCQIIFFDSLSCWKDVTREWHMDFNLDVKDNV